MHELIKEIEKSIGLPQNWKSYPEIYKKFEWIDKLELPDQQLVQKLEEKIGDLEWQIRKMKDDFDEIYDIANKY